MDYVRKRRLVHALAEMEKGKDMLGIALDYGFETQGGMIRAFRKVYGDTPGNYRIQVLAKLPNNIQLAAIGKRSKGEAEMRIGGIENDLVFKRAIILADKLFNITAHRKYGQEFWQKQFLATPELLIYAEDEGKIIGVSFGNMNEDENVTISYVGTEKEHQNKGIEEALVQEMEKRAKALGHTLLAVGVPDEGEEEFWRKCGYEALLLIQSEKNSIEDLRSLNPEYKEVNARVYDGNVNQLFLDVPSTDRELRKKYEEKFPDCNTIMVYTKNV